MTLKNNTNMLEIPFLQKGDGLKLAIQYNKQLELENRLIELRDSIVNKIRYGQNLNNKLLNNQSDSLQNEIEQSQDIRQKIGSDVAQQTINKYKGTNQNPIRGHHNWIDGDVEKLLVNWHIRESPEVVEYFQSYINSPGFNRILQNQDKWWEKRHPYRKYYTSSEINKTKKWYQNRKFPVVFSLNMHSDISWYKPYQHAAYVGQIPSSYDKKTAEFLYETAIGHELSHGVSPSHFNGQKEALDMNQNTKKNQHDEYRSEKMADLWGIRYLLYKDMDNH